MFVFCCLLFSSLSSSRAAAVLKAAEISGGFPGVLILFLFLIRAAATALNLLVGVSCGLRERERGFALRVSGSPDRKFFGKESIKWLQLKEGQ